MAKPILYTNTNNVWGDGFLYNECVPHDILNKINYLNYLKNQGLINPYEYDMILFTGLKHLQLTLHKQSECEEKQRIEAARIVEAERIAAARIVEAARIFEAARIVEAERIAAARIVEAERIAAARIAAARIEVASSFLNPVAAPFKPKMLQQQQQQQQRVLTNFF